MSSEGEGKEGKGDPRIRCEYDARIGNVPSGASGPKLEPIFLFRARQPSCRRFALNANPSSCSGRSLKRAISSNPILPAAQFNLFATAIFA